ncbi:MAG: formate dehydrogenase accessory protein FdhE [Peptococcaceae bacterium]|nr:formate dehydrogenase accessory protein FdhE [Peptococcaceae bacterium]
MNEIGMQFIPPNLVDLYNDLLDAEPAGDAVKVDVPGDDLLEVWKQGMPMLKLHFPQVDVADFFAVMGQVRDILQKHQPEAAGDLDRAYAAMPEDAGEREEFVKSVLRGETSWVSNLVTNSRIPMDAVGILITHTFRPFLRVYAEKVREYLDLDRWLKGICPVCGGKPTFAKLTKTVGRRYLYCNQCNTEWLYNRMGCPYCDTGNKGKVRYFSVEGQPLYRVYICDDCKGYLKTVDESKADEKVELFWEDIKTVHLDILAVREGFVNQALAAGPKQ